ncbi:hypothetical protein HD806DRAFT_537622 [Xylariaceae sp. AK1471]|nr:hypothetical protein HD806DRAFT_537622 [Xylariaceae sp. AK1471]
MAEDFQTHSLLSRHPRSREDDPHVDRDRRPHREIWERFEYWHCVHLLQLPAARRAKGGQLAGQPTTSASRETVFSTRNGERSFNRHDANRTRPSLDEILTALQSVAALYSRVFIVVDALDECQVSDGCRMIFLSKIFSLQAKCGPNIFATSRFIPEYLDHQISRSGLKLLQTYREEIKTEIIKVVEGMFLLAQLHLEALRTKKTLKKMKNVLNSLPTGPKPYDHAYEEVMKRVIGHDPDSEELAKQVLSWITCAIRPLTTWELQHALAVEVGGPDLDEDNLLLVEDMVSVCAGSVVIDEESEIIRLVHYTTQEYFERTQSQWFLNAQSDITTICTTYLSFQVFGSGPSQTDEFEERHHLNPLYYYAV